MPHIKQVTIPDLGSPHPVEVIEVLVSPQDRVEIDSSLVTLEGDKATMEVPAPFSGTVQSILIQVGEQVRSGSVILEMAVEDDATSDQNTSIKVDSATTSLPTKKIIFSDDPVSKSSSIKNTDTPQISSTQINFAGPGVRRLAHQLGIDLNTILGTGEKGRVTRADLEQSVRSRMHAPGSLSEQATMAQPEIDFNQWGSTETVTFSKIKRLTGAHVHQSWSIIPHVTQFDEADISALEEFRKSQQKVSEAKGVKMTLLVFVMKAIVSALQTFPNFNATLKQDGQTLVLKKYYHIGVAVKTPNGLVVPVIREVDQKGLMALAVELAKISQKARTTGLAMADMQGGCFTISSLGGVGGIAFTPIVNSPEVAILGLSRAKMQPIYKGNDFEPRLILPLSLSYDHRVIDGAEAARFTQYVASQLSDIRKLLM